MKSVTVNEDDWEERIITDVNCPYCREWQEVETFWEFETIRWTCECCGKTFYVKTRESKIE